MGALDELLGRWRENPDTGTTLALCTYLGTSKREELIREVGSTAEAWHKDDPQVMLAVGRMYLDAGLLPEAQATLVTAGKLVPDNASAYRYLGEVLLRRGDAARAEAVYEGMTPLSPDDVAEVVVFAATRPPHVTLAEALVLPTQQGSTVHVHRKSQG